MPITDISDIVERLAVTGNIMKLRGVFSNACKQIGVAYFSYTAQIPVSLVRPEYVFVNNYPKALWRRYMGDNLLKTDPLFRYCARNLLPVVWRDTRRFADDEQDLRFMSLLREHGLRDGMTFPTRSREGGLVVISYAVNDSDSGALFANPRHVPADLVLLGAHLHNAIDRLLREQSKNHRPAEISRRERECLLWVAEGKTTEEIAIILDISASTVTFHMQNVIKKLDAGNRQQAIAKAVTMGIITPQTQMMNKTCGACWT